MDRWSSTMNVNELNWFSSSSMSFKRKKEKKNAFEPWRSQAQNNEKKIKKERGRERSFFLTQE